MADLISREAAVRALASSNGDYLDALERIEGLPAVDAAPVVRCRDCKHFPVDEGDQTCIGGFGLVFPDDKCPCKCEDGFYSWMPADDWYCASGERRDDGALSGR